MSWYVLRVVAEFFRIDPHKAILGVFLRSTREHIVMQRRVFVYVLGIK